MSNILGGKRVKHGVGALAGDDYMPFIVTKFLPNRDHSYKQRFN